MIINYLKKKLILCYKRIIHILNYERCKFGKIETKIKISLKLYIIKV